MHFGRQTDPSCVHAIWTGSIIHVHLAAFSQRLRKKRRCGCKVSDIWSSISHWAIRLLCPIQQQQQHRHTQTRGQMYRRACQSITRPIHLHTVTAFNIYCDGPGMKYFVIKLNVIGWHSKSKTSQFDVLSNIPRSTRPSNNLLPGHVFSSSRYLEAEYLT